VEVDVTVASASSDDQLAEFRRSVSASLAKDARFVRQH
jgi:hypothetical protein